MASELIAHVDCQYKTREQLADLPCPEPTRTWKPVPHYELVTGLAAALEARGITITRERFAVGGTDMAKLFGTFDLKVPDVPDTHVGTSLGLRTANDRSWKHSMMAAARVFVCDNLAFSGSGGTVVLSRKHTSGFEIGEVFPPAIDLYLDKCGVWRADIDRMADFELTDGRAKEIVYDAFMGRRAALPVRLMDDVHRLYFDDEIQLAKFEDRSLWSLNNAFTEAVKGLRAVPQQRYGLEIGRYFGKVLNSGERGRRLLPFEMKTSTLRYN